MILLTGKTHHSIVTRERLNHEALVFQYESRIADLKAQLDRQNGQIATLMARLDDKLSSPKNAFQIMHPITEAKPVPDFTELIPDYNTELEQVQKFYEAEANKPKPDDPMFVGAAKTIGQGFTKLSVIE